MAAAASLQDALREIGGNYQQLTHEKIEFVFAGSNVLVQQIRAGAPVDVFFPADEKSMDKISDLIVTRQPLLSNELVVVSTKPIQNLLQLQRLALGDPNAVPAGVYAREYFEKAGTWKTLKSKVIPMENVRAALAAADSDKVDAAVVYRTDALLAKKARVVMTLTGPLIRYPVAVLRSAPHPDAARRFVNYLASPAAADVFRKYGFIRPAATLSPMRGARALATSSFALRSGEKVPQRGG